MIIKNIYVFSQNGISPEDCNKIIKASGICPEEGNGNVLTPPLQEGELFGAKTNKKIRNCKIATLSEQWIYSLLDPLIHAGNEQAGWNFHWDWNEPVQVIRYKKGGHYDWHTDQSHTPAVSADKNFHDKTRKLSLSLQLTDSDAYQGGDLEFRWLSHGEVVTKTLTEAREKGTAVIFPSFIWHRVTPVTKGERISLVNWSIGRPIR